MTGLILLLALAEPLLPGDARNAAKLHRMHCIGCHAADGTPTQAGRSLGAPMLKDPALVAGRTDDQLLTLLLKGTPKHPPPGTALTLLDAADLEPAFRMAPDTRPGTLEGAPGSQPPARAATPRTAVEGGGA